MTRKSAGKRRALLTKSFTETPVQAPDSPPAPAAPDGVVPGAIDGPGSQPWRRPFLVAYANSGNIRAACQLAKISRDLIEDVRREDPRFREEMAKADKDFVDMLRAQAVQRASNGSEKLLMFLLRSHDPATYAQDRRLILTPGGMGGDAREGAPLALPASGERGGASVVRVYLPENHRNNGGGPVILDVGDDGET